MNLDPEKILERISDLIDQHTTLGLSVARLEASFKAWEASTKAAMIDSGMSAAQAESKLRSADGWAERFAELESERVKLQEVKARIEQGDRYWRTWQSEYSAKARAMQ